VLEELTLSRHFTQRYIERVGCPPTEDGVRQIVRGSVVVQRGKDYRLASGRLFNTLSIYWNPRLAMVITVDERRKRAVSVFGEKTLNDAKRLRMIV